MLVGTKKRVYNKNVNYVYNIKHIGFNISNKNNKGEIIYDSKNKGKNEIKEELISEKEAVHFNEIKQIYVIERNIIFNDINKDKDKKKEKDEDKDNALKKNNEIIISMGSEDKSLIFWEKLKKNKNEII